MPCKNFALEENFSITLFSAHPPRLGANSMLWRDLTFEGKFLPYPVLAPSIQFGQNFAMKEEESYTTHFQCSFSTLGAIWTLWRNFGNSLTFLHHLVLASIPGSWAEFIPCGGNLVLEGKFLQDLHLVPINFWNPFLPR